MLCRSHLVVLGLGRNAQLPQLFVHILHEMRRCAPGSRRNNGHPSPVPWAAWRRTGFFRYKSDPFSLGTSPDPPGNIPAPVLQKAATRFAVVLPNRRRIRSACSFTASMERRSGVFLSSASPCVGTEGCGNAERHTNGILSSKMQERCSPRRYSLWPQRWLSGRRTGRRRHPARP